MKSERQLAYWYRKYNRLYFGDSLPTAFVWWEPTSAAYADCKLIDGEWRIRLNPSLSGWNALWKWSLLHEMVHIRLYPNTNHGRRFQAEMLRLATMGAFREVW